MTSEAQKEAGRRYRERHPERFRAKEKRRWAENREKEKARHKKWRVENPEKAIARAKAWKKANPEKVAISKRKNYLKRTYGLVGGDFDALVVAHDGKCAICHNPFSSSRDRHIDHCHATGKVRGLLCSACNTILGMSKDSSKVLISAARYLKMARYLK